MYIIRKAKIEDIEQIYNIGKSSLPIYYEVEYLKYFTNNSNYVLYVAITSENIITGYCLCEFKHNNKVLHIMSIAVHKNYRKQNIGKLLIDKVKEYYTTNNFRLISLYVMKSNIGAINFYKKMEFRMWELLVNFYGNNQDGYLYIYIK